MTALPSPTEAELQAELERDAKRAEELMARDPKLPFISAFIIARDLASADRSLNWLREGKYEWGMAEAFCGSYGRLDLRVKALAEGLITPQQAYADLPSAWSNADPDDTDPRFLALWQEAWDLNRGRVLRDKPGSRLPKGMFLTVYRGQDATDDYTSFGIAWSLDERVARKFAMGAATRQRARGGVVYKARAKRSDIMGYMVGRSEREVIIHPLDLWDITEV
jgi:hypothetical protein